VVGVDGVSVLFLPLTALLTAGVILASWNSVQTLPRLYLALLLALEGITLGIYSALDLGLFFLFWELTLPPIYFLISLWGIGPQRRYAAVKYTLFMLAGGVPLLFGFILLALNHASETGLSPPAGLSFDYLILLETPIPLELQSVIFLLLFFGFAVKAPLFPFHVWLPTAAMEGPAGVSALLMGLKLGLFGIIRFAVPLAPQASQRYFGLMAALGVAGAIYGALIALKQTNLRRMLAFSGISHVGLVLIGIAALNIQGIQGAVFQLLNFGIVAGGAFLIAGFLQHRLGTTELTGLGGVARSMPLLSALFFVLGLASIGVPGTNGFAAEHLIVIGSFKAHTGMGLAALLGTILSAAYFLGFFQKAFLGPITRLTIKEASDLRPRELWVAGIMVLLTLAIGFFPQPLLEASRKPLQAWIARLEAGNPTNLADSEQGLDVPKGVAQFEGPDTRTVQGAAE
jgi:NADH-quinone oxidoreductase subunit M